MYVYYHLGYFLAAFSFHYDVTDLVLKIFDSVYRTSYWTLLTIIGGNLVRHNTVSPASFAIIDSVAVLKELRPSLDETRSKFVFENTSLQNRRQYKWWYTKLYLSIADGVMLTSSCKRIQIIIYYCMIIAWLFQFSKWCTKMLSYSE